MSLAKFFCFYSVTEIQFSTLKGIDLGTVFSKGCGRLCQFLCVTSFCVIIFDFLPHIEVQLVAFTFKATFSPAFPVVPVLLKLS